MNPSLTVKCDLSLERRNRGARTLTASKGKPLPVVEPGRLPRVTRLLALALRFAELLRTGAIRDQAELARLGHVSRARLTQIMNLTLLAPDLQEALLFLPRTLKGRDRVQLAQLQPIALTPDWKKQRRLWTQLLA